MGKRRHEFGNYRVIADISKPDRGPDCERYEVLWWPTPRYATEAEAIAEARGAAAWRELLAALRNCLSLVDLKFGNTDETGSAAQEQARAAIAKATGEGS